MTESTQAWYAGTNDGLFVVERAVDGRASVDLLVPRPVAAIPRAIAANPGNPDGYVAGSTDGCLWATDDGESFQPLVGNLPGIMTLTSVSSAV